MTYSIVAWDPDVPDGSEWGVAVASRFLAAASVVSWAKAGAGAVATQALANVTYGPEGLDLLAEGAPAAEVVERLTMADEGRDHRQLGIIDRTGGAATFTGAECFAWAGGRTGPGYTCQGNILTGPEVIDAMAAAYEGTPGDLAGRLMAALLAGDRSGGDSRGRQSAGLLVVRDGGGFLGHNDVAVDLRVDDHDDPVPELQRILDIHRLIFPRPSDLVFVEIDAGLAAELRNLLELRGYEPGSGHGYDEGLAKALFQFVGTEDLDLRWTDRAEVETVVLERLRDQ